jgi:hypothetical protein
MQTPVEPYRLSEWKMSYSGILEQQVAFRLTVIQPELNIRCAERQDVTKHISQASIRHRCKSLLN